MKGGGGGGFGQEEFRTREGYVRHAVCVLATVGPPDALC